MAVIKAGTYHYNDFLTVEGRSDEFKAGFRTDVSFSTSIDIEITEEHINAFVEEGFTDWTNVPSGTYRFDITVGGISIGKNGSITENSDQDLVCYYCNCTVNNIEPYNEIIVNTFGTVERQNFYEYNYYEESQINGDQWSYGKYPVVFTEDTDVDDEFYAWFTANTKAVISGYWQWKPYEELVFPGGENIYWTLTEYVNVRVFKGKWKNAVGLYLQTYPYTPSAKGYYYTIHAYREGDKTPSMGIADGGGYWGGVDETRLMDFGKEEQLVSDEFYDIIASNAVQVELDSVLKPISGIWKWHDSLTYVENAPFGEYELFINGNNYRFSMGEGDLSEFIPELESENVFGVLLYIGVDPENLIIKLPYISTYGWIDGTLKFSSNDDGVVFDGIDLTPSIEYQIMDFGSEEQYVSVAFYDYLITNAKPYITARTVKDKIRSIIYKANSVTGENNSDLTKAVSVLVDGYGQGEMLPEWDGAYTLSDDVVISEICTGNHIIEVDELPTENIDKTAIYKLKQSVTDVVAVDGNMKIITLIDWLGGTFETIPTKRFTDIKQIDDENGPYWYYIEDENDVYAYVDFYDDQSVYTWVSIRELTGFTNCGCVKDLDSIKPKEGYQYYIVGGNSYYQYFDASFDAVAYDSNKLVSGVLGGNIVVYRYVDTKPINNILSSNLMDGNVISLYYVHDEQDIFFFDQLSEEWKSISVEDVYLFGHTGESVSLYGKTFGGIIEDERYATDIDCYYALIRSKGFYRLSDIYASRARTEEINIVPSFASHVFTTSGGTYYSRVRVEAVPTEEITIYPSTKDVTYRPTTGKFYNEVVVKGIGEINTDKLAGIYLESFPKTEYKDGDSISVDGGRVTRTFFNGYSDTVDLAMSNIWGFGKVYGVESGEINTHIQDAILGDHILTIKETVDNVTAQTTYKITMLPAELVTFTVDNIEYRAKKDSQWYEWMQTKYYIEDSNIIWDGTYNICIAGGGSVVDDSGNIVRRHDYIIDGGIYVSTKTSKELVFQSNGDGTCYISGIGTCADTDIVIPNTSHDGDLVTGVDYMAFYNCTRLTSITIPDSVTSIGKRAFNGCTGLTSINIPDGVTSIGASTFSGCTRLTSITIPDGVTSIGDMAFNYCRGLMSIAIPDSVTSIGNSAFSECASLTSVTIPNGVTGIYYGTFSGCASLTSITIPDSVTSIGTHAFGGCSGLTSIEFKGTIAEWNAITKDLYWNYNVPATKVVCADGKVAIN